MATVDERMDEDRAARDGCGLIDSSQRGKLALTGEQARDFLNGQVTNDVLGLDAGAGCYAAFLTHRGKMLGDLRVLRVIGPSPSLACPGAGEAGELWLDTERVSLQALFDLIRRFQIGYDAAVHKRTLQWGLLSLIGPRSQYVAGAERLSELEHANAPGTIAGHGVHLVSTDLGLDVICAARDTEAVRARLLADGALAIGDEAATRRRIQTGRPRYGIDMDASTIPQEAGLNQRAVSFTKGCYVGQETVARLHYRGRPTRHLRGLRLSEPAQTGEQVLLGERLVGTLGSVSCPPGREAIALALLRREAEPGGQVCVGEAAVRAEVVELPFRC